MDPYQALANAIIEQAVKDYRMTDDPDDLAELEKFFRSEWYGVLTSLDAELLISQLRKEKKLYDSSPPPSGSPSRAALKRFVYSALFVISKPISCEYS